MRVFISYGHDRNAPLVERIRHDLDAAGHETWIDTAEIKTGDDWRRSIVDGIKGSDWVLAFLSKHSTRDPGVCLDELAIALHEKAGAIATVLVEDPAEVAAPVTLRHIQYLDMHDWQARQDSDSAAFEAWYRDRLKEVLGLLESPAVAHFAGETDELRRILDPVAQDADVGRLVEGFVGRQWLLERLDAWRLGEGGSRMFWLTGGPGSGKSAFAAWVAHHSHANAISLNLCMYDIEARRDAARVIRTLAFQLATRLHDYRTLLLERLRSLRERAELDRKPPADLLDWLLVQPLKHCIDGGQSRDRFVAVIDSLDETVRDRWSELASALAKAAASLPAWLALLVTSRPESPVARQLAGFWQETIATGSEENRADVQDYARGWLGGTGRPAAEVERLVARIAEAADGNFLYLTALRLGVETRRLSLDAPEGLPPGLIGLYERWFRYQYPDRAAYERDVLPLLEVIVAAEEPVPEATLGSLFGWSDRERTHHLEELGSLFERRAEGITPFHKSLRDWLVDGRASGAAYVVDEEPGRQRLLEYLWQRFLDGVRAGEEGSPDTFTLTQLPRLLTGKEGREAVAALVASFHRSQRGWLAQQAERLAILLGREPERVAPEDFKAVFARTAAVARQQATRFAWGRARAWWEMAACLSGAAGKPGRGRLARARSEQGRIEETLGNTSGALADYRAALAVHERLAEEYPDDPRWLWAQAANLADIGDVLKKQGDLVSALGVYRDALTLSKELAEEEPTNADLLHNLSTDHDRIGDVLQAQGDLTGALASYHAAFAIDERLAQQHPEGVEWQENLAVSHNKIGGILEKRSDLTGALASYRSALAIREHLAAQEPDNAERQHALSVSRGRIRDMLSKQGDVADALASCEAQLTASERRAKQDPGNADWQRSVAISQTKLGDMLFVQGKPARALESYRAALGIHEKLARQDPNNTQSQRSLALVLSKVGDALWLSGDEVGRHMSFRASLAVREQLAARDPGNAQWQRDLLVGYCKLADALADAGDPAAREHALRAQAQARLCAERFPQDPRREADLDFAEDLVHRACSAEPPDRPPT